MMATSVHTGTKMTLGIRCTLNFLTCGMLSPLFLAMMAAAGAARPAMMKRLSSTLASWTFSCIYSMNIFLLPGSSATAHFLWNACNMRMYHVQLSFWTICNSQLPDVHKYLHRIGFTSRSPRSGVSKSWPGNTVLKYLKHFQMKTGIKGWAQEVQAT
ncbi:unnamed protein product [Triticum turgidum subsp. durum]|uniref:Uncharacterized protein n=1 Tax=Triticum turgidum subsp. durum TaxID=4567 RepID=A0A9R1AWP5_TRITD|nr:unnamed protein product [Triticum turgidum subsp. durum]